MAAALDKLKDFAIGQVAASGFSSSATEIPLLATHAARFALAPGLVVVYDETDHPGDPAAAWFANKAEKIRYSTDPDTVADKLTNLTRGIDGAARNFNVAGHAYVVYQPVSQHHFSAVPYLKDAQTAALPLALELAGDVSAPGGFKHTIGTHFYGASGVGTTAGLAETIMDVSGIQINLIWVAPVAGSLVALAARYSAPITAGSITIRARVNGAAKLTVVLDATAQKATGTATKDVHTFGVGDEVDTTIQTSADLLPGGAYVMAFPGVEY